MDHTIAHLSEDTNSASSCSSIPPWSDAATSIDRMGAVPTQYGWTPDELLLESSWMTLVWLMMRDIKTGKSPPKRDMLSKECISVRLAWKDLEPDLFGIVQTQRQVCKRKPRGQGYWSKSWYIKLNCILLEWKSPPVTSSGIIKMPLTFQQQRIQWLVIKDKTSSSTVYNTTMESLP